MGGVEVGAIMSCFYTMLRHRSWYLYEKACQILLTIYYLLQGTQFMAIGFVTSMKTKIHQREVRCVAVRGVGMAVHVNTFVSPYRFKSPNRFGMLY